MRRSVARFGESLIFLTPDDQYALTTDEEAITEHYPDTPLAFREPREAIGVSPLSWIPYYSPVYDPEQRAHTRGVLAALWWIRRCNTVLRKCGFTALLELLDTLSTKKRPAQPRTTPSALLAEHLAARVWYPRRIECLVGSAALAAHAWRRGLECTFLVGVQHSPFYAHAWVEQDGAPLNDTPENAPHLAAVVSIP